MNKEMSFYKIKIKKSLHQKEKLAAEESEGDARNLNSVQQAFIIKKNKK